MDYDKEPETSVASEVDEALALHSPT